MRGRGRGAYKPPGGRQDQTATANPFNTTGAPANSQSNPFATTRGRGNATRAQRGATVARGGRGDGTARGASSGRGRGDATTTTGRGALRGSDSRGRGRGRGDHNNSSRGGARGGFQGTTAPKRDESHLPADQRLTIVSILSRVDFAHDISILVLYLWMGELLTSDYSLRNAVLKNDKQQSTMALWPIQMFSASLLMPSPLWERVRTCARNTSASLVWFRTTFGSRKM
jgi:hypothetical protein